MIYCFYVKIIRPLINVFPFFPRMMKSRSNRFLFKRNSIFSKIEHDPLNPRSPPTTLSFNLKLISFHLNANIN